MEIVMIYSAPIFLRDSLNCQGEIRQPFYDGSTERFGEMYDCNRATLERYAGVILSFGISSFAIGYLSLQLTIGSAPVFDPRDILVTCAGVFAGPLGGGLVGLLAGIGGSDPLVSVILYTLGGIMTGYIARTFMAEKNWVPGAALGLGISYSLVGLVMIASGSWNRIASLAFQSLIMVFTCIFVLSIIQSLDPHLFS